MKVGETWKSKDKKWSIILLMAMKLDRWLVHKKDLRSGVVHTWPEEFDEVLKGQDIYELYMKVS